MTLLRPVPVQSPDPQQIGRPNAADHESLRSRADFVTDCGRASFLDAIDADCAHSHIVVAHFPHRRRPQPAWMRTLFRKSENLHQRRQQGVQVRNAANRFHQQSSGLPLDLGVKLRSPGDLIGYSGAYR